MVSMVLYFAKCLGLFFTCFVTSPARTDIFRPGGVKNAVSEKLGPESGGGFKRVPIHVGSKVAAKRIRSIQVQTASNGLIFKTGRQLCRQVQGSYGTKFEADRTGAAEAKSPSIFKVSI